MAVETMRGCGYRKVGGLYLVAGDLVAPCDRLPIELTVCRCCGAGIKQAKGWTWIQPFKILGDHGVDNVEENTRTLCTCGPDCPVCWPSLRFGEHRRAGLIWIGAEHYATPNEFMAEGLEQGISRRISAIPREFEIGKTWVFLAHPKAIQKRLEDHPDPEVRDQLIADSVFGPADLYDVPGIFSAFKPVRIERIVLQSEFILFQKYSSPEFIGQMGDCTHKEILNSINYEVFSRLSRDVDRGITLVPVPDNDADHQ